MSVLYDLKITVNMTGTIYSITSGKNRFSVPVLSLRFSVIKTMY